MVLIYSNPLILQEYLLIFMQSRIYILLTLLRFNREQIVNQIIVFGY